jgi:Flp pilus assembly CpaF family ATPase
VCIGMCVGMYVAQLLPSVHTGHNGARTVVVDGKLGLMLPT